jgi:hypothetical protein
MWNRSYLTNTSLYVFSTTISMRGRLNLAANGHGRYASPYLSSEIPNTGHTADLPAPFPEHSWPTPYQSETQAHQGETSYVKTEFSPDN